MGTPWLHRCAVVLAVCTFLLVIAGALLTTYQTSATTTSSPVSNRFLVGSEQVHQVVAATVGLVTLVFAVGLRRTDPRPWMQRIGFVLLGAVVLQGALGALSLPKSLGVLHACLAQVYFATTVAMAVFTSRSWQQQPSYVEDSGWPSLRSLALAAAVVVFAQVALGAAYRHGALSVMPHVVGSIVVTAIILMVSIFVLAQFGSHPVLRRSAMVLISITCLQVVLGIGAYMARLNTTELPYPVASAVLVAVAHVATGALTLAASTVLAIQVLRNVRPHLSEAAGHLSPVSR